MLSALMRTNREKRLGNARGSHGKKLEMERESGAKKNKTKNKNRDYVLTSSTSSLKKTTASATGPTTRAASTASGRTLATASAPGD